MNNIDNCNGNIDNYVYCKGTVTIIIIDLETWKRDILYFYFDVCVSFERCLFFSVVHELIFICLIFDAILGRIWEKYRDDKSTSDIFGRHRKLSSTVR